MIEEDIKQVDKFAEKLRDDLTMIGERGDWGANFTVSKAQVSDYWRSQVIVRGEPVKKNWLQLNGQTYSHPSYRSPKAWKVQARFDSPPDSPLWEKKPAYIRDRQPLEWSLGGLDVWAIAYERLSAAFEVLGEADVEFEILFDLRSSWAYANCHKQELVGSSSEPQGRVQVTLSINSEIWGDFQQASSRDYRSRRKHSNRPSYAKLREEAIDEALLDYIAKYVPGEVNDDDKGDRIEQKGGTHVSAGRYALEVELNTALVQQSTATLEKKGKTMITWRSNGKLRERFWVTTNGSGLIYLPPRGQWASDVSGKVQHHPVPKSGWENYDWLYLREPKDVAYALGVLKAEVL